jgi:ABC-2 type transport system permease protein
MSAMASYLVLVRMHLQSFRPEIPVVVAVQIAFAVGFVLGFGYLIPDIDNTTALFITGGAATQNLVMVGCVMLPQFLAMGRQEGRLDYFLSLPISREAYLLANVTVAACFALPGVALAILVGMLRYDLDFSVSPALLVVVPMVILALAGVGIAMVIFIPGQAAVVALTQVVIFYVIFFSPVLIPAERLPGVLQFTAQLLPPSYAADAMRASLTGLPDTNLARSLAALTLFGVLSSVASAIAIRHRG